MLTYQSLLILNSTDLRQYEKTTCLLCKQTLLYYCLLEIHLCWRLYLCVGDYTFVLGTIPLCWGLYLCVGDYTFVLETIPLCWGLYLSYKRLKTQNCVPVL